MSTDKKNPAGCACPDEAVFAKDLLALHAAVSGALDRVETIAHLPEMGRTIELTDLERIVQHRRGLRLKLHSGEELRLTSADAAAFGAAVLRLSQAAARANSEAAKKPTARE